MCDVFFFKCWWYNTAMSSENFLSLGRDIDEAAMAMDRRSFGEQLKGVIKKIIHSKENPGTNRGAAIEELPQKILFEE